MWALGVSRLPGSGAFSTARAAGPALTAGASPAARVPPGCVAAPADRLMHTTRHSPAGTTAWAAAGVGGSHGAPAGARATIPPRASGARTWGTPRAGASHRTAAGAWRAIAGAWRPIAAAGRAIAGAWRSIAGAGRTIAEALGATVGTRSFPGALVAHGARAGARTVVGAGRSHGVTARTWATE